mmetsp:Transcript_21987/g.60222  ORF Transcript_21987/g.60222 Transcript_21987/m.60222 type:complete len:115 (+) Transcript_21987:217-561(+)
MCSRGLTRQLDSTLRTAAAATAAVKKEQQQSRQSAGQAVNPQRVFEASDQMEREGGRENDIQPPSPTTDTRAAREAATAVVALAAAVEARGGGERRGNVVRIFHVHVSAGRALN